MIAELRLPFDQEMTADARIGLYLKLNSSGIFEKYLKLLLIIFIL